ncbi:MOP flippase family protein [Myroides odoratimimus]|uniref:MOP flippase family protein n=1 Tax=Myroides odoratimimus TaxID=76832 RepID=UPI0025760144|nr:MOP flippase family protein [Myroides odoratimimus]MDM1444011.1 MOP flippase family protein [Myroides odoratimimus]
MSIGNQIKSGIGWTAISTIVIAIVAIVKVSVLARYLDKSDFGLMAIVTFIISFMELFNDFGISIGILHKQNISKNEYHSLYWINLAISVFLFFILLGITPFISSFYNMPELKYLLILIGINLIISGIGRQFKTIEQKELRFKFIALVDILGAVFSLFLAIWLAVYGYGVLSLVYSLIIQFSIVNLCYFVNGLKRHGLSFHFKFKETVPFLKIGAYQVGGQVANYFNKDLDILLIGKIFSPDLLGGYSLAKQLVYKVFQFFNPIIMRVASPMLARFQNDKSELRLKYLDMLNIVSTVNILVYVLLIIFAPLAVNILYGSHFESIVVLVRFFSIYMIFRAIGNTLGSLVIATGRTDLDFYWNIILLFIMPPFIYGGSNYGIIGVVISLVISMIVLYVPAWKLFIDKLLGVSLKEYFLTCFKIDINRIRKLLKDK